MSDQHRGGAWGGNAENAVWWPSAISADQSNLQQHHQQLLNQHHQQNHLQQQQQQQQQQIHQVVVQQQQNQSLSDVSRSNSTSSAASQQLFSYKMANSFPSSGVVPTSSAYDYRLGMGAQSGMSTNPSTQWWYTTAGQNALENLQQQQVTQQQSQVQQHQTQIQQHQTQNIHNVHSNTTPVSSAVWNLSLLLFYRLFI